MTISLGDRMKNNYENRSRYKLSRRTPVIMRLDGKAFHTLTKGCKKPFDTNFIIAMSRTCLETIEHIQGAKCAYIQSDEMSILITDFDKLNTDAWFDYNIQKMTSIAASYASINFCQNYEKIGVFDCRVFNIPKEEVCNYFIWRQQDWERNSVQMLAQSIFSHKELHNKSISDMHEMLHGEGINWATDCIDREKNGAFIKKNEEGWHTVYETPIFKNTRYVIENYLEGDGE